jgi:hypothetical protein
MLLCSVSTRVWCWGDPVDTEHNHTKVAKCCRASSKDMLEMLQDRCLTGNTNFGRSLLVTCFVSRFWFVGQMCPSCPWVSCKKKQERFLYFRYFSLGWEVSLVARIAVKPLVGLNTLLPGVDSVMTSSKWFSFNVMTWWAKGEEMTSSSKP